MALSPADTTRAAFQAFLHLDMQGLEAHIHPHLEWTFLDPSSPNPAPSTCYGRVEIEAAAARWKRMGLPTVIEAIESVGDHVVVVLYAAGLDRLRARAADDRNYYVATVHDAQITKLQACCDLAEARRLVGLS